MTGARDADWSIAPGRANERDESSTSHPSTANLFGHVLLCRELPLLAVVPVPQTALCPNSWVSQSRQLALQLPPFHQLLLICHLHLFRHLPLPANYLLNQLSLLPVSRRCLCPTRCRCLASYPLSCQLLLCSLSLLSSHLPPSRQLRLSRRMPVSRQMILSRRCGFSNCIPCLLFLPFFEIGAPIVPKPPPAAARPSGSPSN